MRIHRVFVPNEIHPGSLLETLFMDRVLEHSAWHIRTADWPTDIPLDALTALVRPDRLVEYGKKWYGWSEREQMILCLTVGYGEANAWVASSDLRALDREIARLRVLLPERSAEDVEEPAQLEHYAAVAQVQGLEGGVEGGFVAQTAVFAVNDEEAGGGVT